MSPTYLNVTHYIYLKIKNTFPSNCCSVSWHVLKLNDIFSHCAASHNFAHTCYMTTVSLTVQASLLLLIQVVKMSHTEKNRLSLISTAAAVLCRICVICLQEICIIYYIEINYISSIEMHYHSCEPEQA